MVWIGVALKRAEQDPRATAIWETVSSTLLRFGPVAAFIFTAIVVGDDANPSLSFYEVSAQVIPLLIVALAFETRIFDVRSATDPQEATFSVVVGLILALGEYYALRSVWSATGDGADYVAGSIAAGFVGLLAGALAPRRS